MLVTFSSDAYENIIFFENVAKNLLQLMGHTATIPGALTPQEIPSALANLKAGLQNQQNTPVDESNSDDEPPISLSHRAIPLIAMLKAAEKDKCNVLWN